MFSFFRDADQIETIESQITEMLANCQDAFRLATSALFNEGDTAADGEALRTLDKEINRSERAIRRELLVHGTVRGAETDLGLMLTYMSLAKDIERIGDKCKDIWELADMGATFTSEPDASEMRKWRDHVAQLLRDALDAFSQDDAAKVHELIPAILEDEEKYDAQVVRYAKSDLPAREATPKVLFYRYIKRLSAHVANILSSVVMPVDRIDFYNPDKSIDEELLQDL